VTGATPVASSSLISEMSSLSATLGGPFCGELAIIAKFFVIASANNTTRRHGDVIK
jgi:hypothetical protein